MQSTRPPPPLVATPANRGRVTRWLGRLGSRGSEAEEAAAIAMLLGRANPERALATAEALFRCLPASQLTAEDLADSGATGSRRASPASMSAVTAFDLAAKTIPARLGEVTAFLSHSWKDEEEIPGAKYTAIAQWAHCQRRKTGHEPTLWLVRACPAKVHEAHQHQSLPAPPHRTRPALTRPTLIKRSRACQSSSPAARGCSLWRGRPSAAASG